MVDTDTMSYIIPYTVVQAFLEKQGDIVTPEKKINTDFAPYMQSIQAQTNKSMVNTPFFSLPTTDPLSFVSYNFDASRNLYSVALSTQDAKTQLLVATSMDVTGETINSGPAISSGDDKDLGYLEEYCTSVESGSKTLGNAEWDYIRCDKIIGDNSSIRVFETEATGGVLVNAGIISEATTQKPSDDAEKVLNKITIKTDAPVNNFNIYNIGPVSLPKVSNLNMSYFMDEGGEIHTEATLSNTSTDIGVSFSFDQYTERMFNVMAKGDTLQEAV